MARRRRRRRLNIVGTLIVLAIAGGLYWAGRTGFLGPALIAFGQAFSDWLSPMLLPHAR